MKQILMGSSNGAITPGSAAYYVPCGVNANTSTLGRLGGICPADFDASALRVTLSAAPGAGDSATVTLMKNGVDTAVAVTISETDTAGTYAGAAVAFAAGDVIEIKTTGSGTPAATIVRWAYLIDTGTTTAIGLGGSANNNVSFGSVNYLTPALNCGQAVPSATEADVYMPCSLDATITALYATIDSETSGTYSFQIMLNGSPVGTAVDITGTAGNVTGMSITMAPGDLLSVRSTPTSAGANRTVRLGIAYTPTTPGQSMIGGATSNGPSTSAVNYAHWGNSLGVAWDGTSTKGVLSAAQQWIFKRLRVLLTTAPGAGNSWAFTFYNGSAQTNTLTISETDTTGADSTHEDTVATDSVIAIHSSPTSGPTAAGHTMWSAIMAPVAPPTLDSITPNSGPRGGGTAVTLAGSDFVDTPTVTIGGAAATSVVFVNSTSVTAVTPAGTPGAKDVVLTNPDAQADTLSGGFTYTGQGGGGGGGRPGGGGGGGGPGGGGPPGQLQRVFWGKRKRTR